MMWRLEALRECGLALLTAKPIHTDILTKNSLSPPLLLTQTPANIIPTPRIQLLNASPSFISTIHPLHPFPRVPRPRSRRSTSPSRDRTRPSAPRERCCNRLVIGAVTADFRTRRRFRRAWDGTTTTSLDVGVGFTFS